MKSFSAGQAAPARGTAVIILALLVLLSFLPGCPGLPGTAGPGERAGEEGQPGDPATGESPGSPGAQPGGPRESNGVEGDGDTTQPRGNAGEGAGENAGEGAGGNAGEAGKGGAGEAPGVGETLPVPGEGGFYPNELGQAMILMYHRIGEPEGEWTRTPENFRRDLEVLYEQGYRSVGLLDYTRGEIDLPPGTSPVIITFDDSTPGQFNYLEGPGGPEIDPRCAVGIMEDFYREYPEFGRAASFYIFYPLPFGQEEYIGKKLAYLREEGYEIGNHSYSHANLSRLSGVEVARELARHAGETAGYLPGYQVRSLALPYGAPPRDRSLLVEGEYQGIAYKNEAVLLVGANPAPSPFSQDFDPLRLPRVRASEMKVEGVGMYDWLAFFERNPERRYVSDGNPQTITAPERYRDRLDPDRVGLKEVVFYGPGAGD